MAHGPSHKKFGAHWLFGENSWYQQSGLKERLTGAESKGDGKGGFGKLGSIDLTLGQQEMMLIYIISAVVIFRMIK